MIDERILGKEVAPDGVETQRAPLPPDARKKSDQRRRAKRTMIIVTLVCVAVGSAPAAEQLVRHGWHAFVDRAPGVGGTPSTPEEANVPVQEVPAAPAPRPPKGTRLGKPATAHPSASSPLRSASNSTPKLVLNTRPVAAVNLRAQRAFRRSDG